MKQNRLDRAERFFTELIAEKGGDQGRSRPVRVLLWYLTQLSGLYWLVIQLRLFLYHKGIFRHHTLGCQVISVGNLTVGGTGKTPVVEIFAREHVDSEWFLNPGESDAVFEAKSRRAKTEGTLQISVCANTEYRGETTPPGSNAVRPDPGIPD